MENPPIVPGDLFFYLLFDTAEGDGECRCLCTASWPGFALQEQPDHGE